MPPTSPDFIFKGLQKPIRTDSANQMFQFPFRHSIGYL
jgi:hypothetical protein